MADQTVITAVDNFMAAANTTAMRSACNADSDSTVAYSSPYVSNADDHAWDAIIRMTMAGNLEIAVPTNGTNGQRIRYVLTASGEVTITLDINYKLLNGSSFSGLVADTHVRLIEVEKTPVGWLVIRNQQFTP